MDLRGKVVVVTGAGSGLGREVLSDFAEHGAEVVAADLDGTAAQAAAESVRASEAAAAHGLEIDVGVDVDCERLVDFARELGGPHVLVNNAGGWTSGEQFPKAAARDWSATLDLNLRAPMLLTQLCLEPMVAAGGGAVVNIASSGGIGYAAYGSPEYGAAKAGLIRFTSCLSDVASTDGVRVSCVVPDWIGLPRARRQWAELPEERRAVMPPLIPPADVVRVVVDLVRDDSPSGTVVELSGDGAHAGWDRGRDPNHCWGGDRVLGP